VLCRLKGTNLYNFLPSVRGKPYIIFGCDVAHPTSFDPNEPSVAAVVASMNIPMTRWAASAAQGCRAPTPSQQLPSTLQLLQQPSLEVWCSHVCMCSSTCRRNAYCLHAVCSSALARCTSCAHHAAGNMPRVQQRAPCRVRASACTCAHTQHSTVDHAVCISQLMRCPSSCQPLSPMQGRLPAAAAHAAASAAGRLTVIGARRRFASRVLVQAGRTELVANLQYPIRELLIAFYQVNRVKPEAIVFFRDGVSEGEYDQVGGGVLSQVIPYITLRNTSTSDGQTSRWLRCCRLFVT
jgi:hypothetical protein